MLRRSPLAVLILIVLLRSMSAAGAAEREPAQLFPPTITFYAELRDPGRLLDLVLHHPLRKSLESLDGVQEAYERQGFLDLKAIVAVVESQLGATWPKLLTSAAGQGAAVGFDAKTKGVALVIKGQNETTGARLVEKIVSLARQDASNKGAPDPVQTAEYRGVAAYTMNQATLAVSGAWIVVANNSDLGKLVVDNLLDESDSTLAADPQFRAARTAAPEDAAVWGYVNVAALREAGVAPNLYAGKPVNPGAEVLVGGILSDLQYTPFATAAVSVDEDKIRVEFATPYDHKWIPETRYYFFGAEGNGVAPPRLRANHTILSVGTYRDLSQMWLRAGDLFDEQVNNQLAEAESGLSTLLSGKDFAEDVLGSFQPEFQLVVVRQEPGDGPQPAIKLPAFAIVFQLKEPDAMRAEFRRTFQSLVGFFNVVGAMNGQPQLDLDMEKGDDYQIVFGTYVHRTSDDPARLPIQFNFSPAIAFVGDRFIISSTLPLARELVTADVSAQTPSANSEAVVDFQALRDVLADNRGQLVAQNMLTSGHTNEEAEKDVGVLVDLVGLLRDASLKFTNGDQTMRIQLELHLTNLDSP